ncbi:MAG: hypothetical protein V1676_05605 [Candidatus Diapherotrites archaeon]
MMDVAFPGKSPACGVRGQIAAIDFLFGLFIFLLIVAWLLSVWTNNMEVAIGEQNFDEMRMKGFQIMDVLVRTPGTPENWEGTGITNISTIGLAYKDRVVDANKLAKFIWLGDIAHEYAKTKEIFGIVPYDYEFTLDGIEDFNTGKPIEGAPIVISMERTVLYLGSDANAKIAIYWEE